ncbi:zinc-ribbon domain-containing protein [Bacillus toyonensis]|uniref:zinc-ribbon domain-containing protein n=1 Tax=Bacillus toyonensis TaxID=155322 RepID=UPI00164283C6|nr:zinc-ribbon domain-containing protein [Bacillus toyonensis]
MKKQNSDRFFPAELLEEWNFKKNGNLKPEAIKQVNQIVWWICDRKHEWQTSLHNRMQGKRCPYCTNKKAGYENSFAAIKPSLVKGWHTGQNKLPLSYLPGSDEKIWRTCQKGHTYLRPVKKHDLECPYCKGRAGYENSISAIYPRIAKEWCPAKNLSDSPVLFTRGSTKKIWWRCTRQHEWEAGINRRINGLKCTYCSGKRPGYENTVAAVNPKLVQQWNWKKNTSSPLELTPGKNDKIWWVCKRGHEWDAVLYSRNSGVGCPYCKGKEGGYENSVAARNPNLSLQWHTSKNNSLIPLQRTLGSGENVIWKCKRGHEWPSTIDNRNKKRGCPYCGGKNACNINCLAATRPELAVEWHPDNSKTPLEVTAGANSLYLWRCKFNHEWPSTVNNRACNNRKCRVCFHQTSYPEQVIIYYLSLIFNDLKQGYMSSDIYIPQLKLFIEYDGYQWHKDKVIIDSNKNLKIVNANKSIIRIRENGLANLTNSINLFINQRPTDADLDKVVLQLLKKIGEYCNVEINRISVNTKLDKIKILSNLYTQKIAESFGENYPELTKEWNTYRNLELTPYNFSRGSNQLVWWICSKGHEWDATFKNRAKGSKCLYCARKKVGYENSLAAVNPILAKEWHLDKNVSDSPINILPSKNIKVWWICSRGHEWKELIYGRNSKKRICPICSGKSAGYENSLAAINPKLSKSWHKEDNGLLTPMHVTIKFNRLKKHWIFDDDH